MRRSRIDAIATAVAMVAALAVMFVLAHKRKTEPTTTVPAWEPPISAPADVEPCPEPSPTPVIGRAARELTFRGPDGVLVLPWGTWYDTLDAECARKALALAARWHWPLAQRQPIQPVEEVNIREAEHGAAWKACPEFRR